MRKISLLALVTIAGLFATGPAIAGHEWTDGTMGPPSGRSYDTTMPIFPTEKRTVPKTIEEPSQVCDHDAISNSAAAPSGDVAKQDAAPRKRNDDHPTNVRLDEICKSRVQ